MGGGWSRGACSGSRNAIQHWRSGSAKVARNKRAQLCFVGGAPDTATRPRQRFRPSVSRSHSPPTSRKSAAHLDPASPTTDFKEFRIR
jgi:hypothetical protein